MIYSNDFLYDTRPKVNGNIIYTLISTKIYQISASYCYVKLNHVTYAN